LFFSHGADHGTPHGIRQISWPTPTKLLFVHLALLLVESRCSAFAAGQRRKLLYLLLYR